MKSDESCKPATCYQSKIQFSFCRPSFITMWLHSVMMCIHMITILYLFTFHKCICKNTLIGYRELHRVCLYNYIIYGIYIIGNILYSWRTVYFFSSYRILLSSKHRNKLSIRRCVLLYKSVDAKLKSFWKYSFMFYL